MRDMWYQDQWQKESRGSGFHQERSHRGDWLSVTHKHQFDFFPRFQDIPESPSGFQKAKLTRAAGDIYCHTAHVSSFLIRIYNVD